MFSTSRVLPALLAACLFFAVNSSAPAAPAAAPATPAGPVNVAFRFEPQGFKFINHDAEFRDVADVLWPNFFTGRPAAGGTLVLGAKPSVNLTIIYDQMLQKSGDQSRRVLGEVSGDGKFPVVTLTLNRLSGLRPEEPKAGAKAKPGRYTAQFEGTVKIGERGVAVKPEGTLVVTLGNGGAAVRLTLDAVATFKPAELGLAKLPADTVIKVRFTTNGTPATAAAPAKP